MKSRKILLMSSFILCFLMPLNLAEDLEDLKFGIYGGLSANPNQVFGGARIDVGTLMPHFYIVTRADLGIGQDITLLETGADLQFNFSLGGTIQSYIGVGVSAVIDTKKSVQRPGVSFPVGLKFGRNLFIEARLGIEHSPHFRLSLGLFL